MNIPFTSVSIDASFRRISDPFTEARARSRCPFLFVATEALHWFYPAQLKRLDAKTNKVTQASGANRLGGPLRLKVVAVKA